MTPSVSVTFVYGALRSGTTLFRLMLNSHERVGNPGEADFLFDYLHPDAGHPTGWRYDLHELRMQRIFRAHDLTLSEGRDGLDLLHDFLGQFQARVDGRLTLNLHRHADRVAALLPDARIIHLLRDPRDVARSSIGMGWAGTSYHGVSHWIGTERDWDAAEARLDPDRVLTLKFEELMTDLTGSLGRVCAFLDVPPSAAMLEYHRDSSYGPPDPGIAQQWRRKAGPREIALIEGRCGDLLERRGYRPNGTPATPGAAERVRLEVDHRTGRWRRNISRFGLPLFLAGHVTRLPGLRRLHDRVRLAKDDRIVRSLR